MPIVFEDIINNTLLPKAIYSHGEHFIKAWPSPIPQTPLGSDWVFKPYTMISAYKTCAEKLENFQVYEDDTWVVTFPKCGTTWTQIMVWLLNNNLDYELELETPLIEKFPYVDYESVYDVNITSADSEHNSVERTAKLKRPRNIKSHLPAGLLPQQLWTVKPKIIYVARNPKDAAMSFFRHYRNLHGYRGTLMDFLEVFLNDLVIYQPFHQHVLEFWNMRHEPNILFINYEEMQMDLMGVVRRVATFLGKTNYTEDQLQKLCKHLNVDQMRTNTSVNEISGLREHANNLGYEMPDTDYRFIGKGKSGAFRDDMPPEMIKRYDDWTTNALKNSDFRYGM